MDAAMLARLVEALERIATNLGAPPEAEVVCFSGTGGGSAVVRRGDAGPGPPPPPRPATAEDVFEWAPAEAPLAFTSSLLFAGPADKVRQSAALCVRYGVGCVVMVADTRTLKAAHVAATAAGVPFCRVPNAAAVRGELRVGDSDLRAARRFIEAHKPAVLSALRPEVRRGFVRLLAPAAAAQQQEHKDAAGEQQREGDAKRRRTR